MRGGALSTLGGRRTVPAGWQKVILDDIKSPEPGSCAAGPFGSNISRKFFVESGIPVIRGNNLSKSLTPFIPDGFAFVTEERTRANYQRCLVRGGDLVFTCWGTIGQVGLIPENGPFDEYVISNKQLKLRVNPQVANSRFVYYYLASSAGVDYLESRATGAAVPGINLGILKSIEIGLPELSIQDEIVRVVSAYDDLIDNNTRRVAILEEAIRLLYQEWFVYLRFPGHDRIEVDDGIPGAWERLPLGSITTMISRGVSPKYDEESPDRAINQRCIRGRRINLGLARRHKAKVSEAKRLRQWDVLVNSTGVGTLGRVAQVAFTPERLTVDTHVTIVRPDGHQDPLWFGVSMESLEPQFERMGYGATGQTELRRTLLSGLEVLRPPVLLQQKFGQQIRPLRKQCSVLLGQSEQLREALSLLLPRLMNGSIAV